MRIKLIDRLSNILNVLQLNKMSLIELLLDKLIWQKKKLKSKKKLFSDDLVDEICDV